VFAREDVTPLIALDQLGGDAGAAGRGGGLAIARATPCYAALVERQLADVRRPAALRRLVALVALGNWSVWAAKLARDTRVDISSAWRTLEQAADLGVGGRSAGAEAVARRRHALCRCRPLLRMAGLMSVRRGRPVVSVFRSDEGGGT
jgi:hypothetical protein